MRIVGVVLDPAAASASPAVEVLLEELHEGRQLTVTRVVVPSAGGMREHDHGDAETLIVAVAGELVMTSGSQRENMAPGTVVQLERGERVQLVNHTSEPFTMIMIFTSRAEPATPGAEPSIPAWPGEAADSLEWVLAVPPDQLADDAAVHVDLEGYPLCLARSGGLVYAILDECSHGQVELSEGDVEGGFVECWLHGSRFDLSTGEPAGPPATHPVPVYPVRITDAGIEVALPATPRGD